MTFKSSWINGSTTIYQLLIDRFSGFDDGKSDKTKKWVGGTLQGIIEKIPYFCNLGINCILLSPFFEGTSYHGYHVTDLYHVDPHFGSEDDLKRLVKSCHDNGIRVVMDFVANHCSWKHPFFREARQGRNNKYRQWFTFTKWPDQYLSYQNSKDLPQFNFNNPQVKRYLIKCSLFWLTKFGFDGMRLDYAVGPPIEFWKEFRREIKRTIEECVLIGEVWANSKKQDDLMLSYAGIFDACLDFTFNKKIKEFLVKDSIDLKELTLSLKKHYAKFPVGFWLPTFLDNHDMNRFLFEVDNDKNKLKWAAEIQFTISQPKVIYYGTEIGLPQDKDLAEFSHNGDLQVRRKMAWNQGEQDAELLRFYKSLLSKHGGNRL